MTNKSQSDKFKEAARELECDEDEKHFDAIVKNIANPKPTEKAKGERNE